MPHTALVDGPKTRARTKAQAALLNDWFTEARPIRVIEQRGGNVTNRAEFGTETAAAPEHGVARPLISDAAAYRWEALLQDQRNKTVARSERHETADLTRRYGEIGISAVAAAVRFHGRETASDVRRAEWALEHEDAA